jgi:hypothetical protein
MIRSLTELFADAGAMQSHQNGKPCDKYPHSIPFAEKVIPKRPGNNPISRALCPLKHQLETPLSVHV